MSESNQEDNDQRLARVLTDVMIRFGVVTIIIVLCIQVFAPFFGIMMWALILAVALYPLNLSLAKKFNGNSGRAAALIVIIGLLLIGGPAVALGKSFTSHLLDLYTEFNSGKLHIQPPNSSVAELPLIGETLNRVWTNAADDLEQTLKNVEPQLKELSKKAVVIAASTTGEVFSFFASMVIAGIMMAYGRSGSQAMLEILQRVSSEEKGGKLQALCVGTIRSVATGVIGVAFIQALLLGAGFIFAGIPGAGILGVIVLVVGILQIPAALVTLPAIAYLWFGGDASTASNIAFTVYLFVAGLADNVLKPMLLGRGVDAPMPVVLLGALGGMVVAGIMGLFVGSVLLTVGYKIFMEWVKEPIAVSNS